MTPIMNQLQLQEYDRINEAKSAFKSLRRKMMFRRIAALIFPFCRGNNSDISLPDDLQTSSVRRLPVGAIRGVARRNGSTGPLPIPALKLEQFWIMMWCIEDTDAIPEVAVIHKNDGWYLADDARSIVIYLLLRHNGALSFNAYPAEANKKSDCQMHDFSEKNSEKEFASAG
jgi:hypothetical protein